MNLTTIKKGADLKNALRSLGAGACSLALLVTMGCWGETPPLPPAASSRVAGKVVQGEVSGATVFADRLDSGTRFLLDVGEASTTTDAHGNFQLTPSYTNYVIVSTGGTDTITGQKAITMLAPAGARNVSALTTLVALNPAMQSKIEALGVSFDGDLSASVTPAALLLAKSVEATVQAFSDAVAKSGSVSPAAAADVQLQVLNSLAGELSKSSVTSATLSTPASLQSAVSNAVVSAAIAVQSADGGITVTNSAAFAGSISGTVTQVAAAINPTAGTATPFNTSASAAAPEVTQLNVTTINNALSAAATSGAASVTVAADTTPPTVASVSPANGSTGIQYSQFTAIFSEAMDPSTLNGASVTLAGGGKAVAGVVTYNPLTMTVTFTPSVKLQINTPYTATITAAVTDLAGNHLAADKVWQYTTTLSGSSGSVPF